MNVFFLHRKPKKCAQMHCDKHSGKMNIEYAQLLSTAHHEFDSPIACEVYKKTHVNHPSAVWVRESTEHYYYVYDLMLALGEEWKQRYGGGVREHLTITKMRGLLAFPPEGLPEAGWTDPPQCMPDECKRDDAVLGYLTYYNHKADDWDSRGMTMTWYGRAAE